MEADGDGTFQRYCDSMPCRKLSTFRKKEEDGCLRCELCNVAVVRHHCDRCRMVAFFERKVDGYFYCERCEDEMVVPQYCFSSECNGALTILKWDKVTCLFHCPQCNTLRDDILRTAPDFSSLSDSGYIFKFISAPPTPPNEEVDDMSHPVIKMKRVRSLTDEDMWGKKRVFIGDNIHLPFDENQHITDDTPIRASVPTTRHLIDHGAKTVLASHLGRPGDVIPEYCLKPHVPGGELDPPLQSTKSDSGFEPSKGSDEQLTPVRTKYKRRRR